MEIMQVQSGEYSVSTDRDKPDLGLIHRSTRVITDYTTFAYLADVFIIPSYRGKVYKQTHP